METSSACLFKTGAPLNLKNAVYVTSLKTDQKLSTSLYNLNNDMTIYRTGYYSIHLLWSKVNHMHNAVKEWQSL